MERQADRPRTYVLVHGGSHGGWCWRDVATVLRAAGHVVFTPTQTGLGERRHLMGPGITLDTFVEDIANLIEAEELDDVCLVGHSFGGCSVVGVAERVPQCLRHIVFVDAIIPASGQSVMSGFPADVREARIAAAQQFSAGSAHRCRRQPISACRWNARAPRHWRGCSADSRRSRSPLTSPA